MSNTNAGWRGVSVAVDIGGTSTRVALAQLSGAETPQLHPIATFATEQAYDAQVARVAQAVRSATAQAQRLGLPEPEGIGVSLGGRIAPDGSGVSIAPNLRDYEGRPFVQQMREECGGAHVRMAHDAVCGLLAERRYGALRAAERCAYLTLSTGTGCATHLQAAGSERGVTTSIEMGHQILAGNERPCLCGQIGCLETYTGGRQLEMRYGQPIERLPNAPLWDEMAEMLGVGLVNLAQLTRVERVAIGGAIALNRPELLEALRTVVAKRLRGARLDLTLAALGAEAPLIGAATLLTTPADEIVS